MNAIKQRQHVIRLPDEGSLESWNSEPSCRHILEEIFKEGDLRLDCRSTSLFDCAVHINASIRSKSVGSSGGLLVHVKFSVSAVITSRASLNSCQISVPNPPQRSSRTFGGMCRNIVACSTGTTGLPESSRPKPFFML